MAILLKLTLTAICVCMLQPNDCVGVLNWLWGSGEEEAAVSHKRLDNEFVNTDVSSVLAKIPFELQPADEKFFNEATKLTDMTSSQLDGCHHKVVGLSFIFYRPWYKIFPPRNLLLIPFTDYSRIKKVVRSINGGRNCET